MKFHFVILHYQTIEDTLLCIESILKQETEHEINIIVVDNASPNQTGQELLEKFTNHQQVEVVLNEENLGFAKGNNIGFAIAKNKGADFVIVSNNDIELMQKSFVEMTMETYVKHQFDIMGPDIINKSGTHQNPAMVQFKDEVELRKLVRQRKAFYYLTFLDLDIYLPRIKKKLLGKSRNQKYRESLSPRYDTLQKGVKLHGSFLIFSKNFIDNYDGFYPHTFLYGEEDILYFIAKRDQLLTLYDPKVKVFHKEDSATNTLFKSSKSKRRFYYQHQVNSHEELLKMMSHDE